MKLFVGVLQFWHLHFACYANCKSEQAYSSGTHSLPQWSCTSVSLHSFSMQSVLRIKWSPCVTHALTHSFILSHQDLPSLGYNWLYNYVNGMLMSVVARPTDWHGIRTVASQCRLHYIKPRYSGIFACDAYRFFDTIHVFGGIILENSQSKYKQVINSSIIYFILWHFNLSMLVLICFNWES